MIKRLKDLNYKKPCDVFALYQKRAANWIVPEGPSFWRKGVRERDENAAYHENSKHEPNCATWFRADYRSNDYVDKATIARLTTGRGLFKEFDGLIGGQDVTSMIGLQMTNPKSGSGSSSFDLALKNSSTQTIFTPLILMVSKISSASGRVTVANAGNGKTGIGATWDYSGSVGSDNMLTGGESSLSRNLKFNNPANEPFTVTFSVVGVLASGGGGGSGGTSSSTSGSSSGSTSTSSSVNTTGTLTKALLSVTYNPLLNTVTWQVIKP